MGFRLLAERQATFERRSMAFGDELVLGSTTLLLRALRTKQVTEAGRAADELALGGQLEALSNGLFGLLHEESGGTQTAGLRLARGIFQEMWRPGPGLRRGRPSIMDGINERTRTRGAPRGSHERLFSAGLAGWRQPFVESYKEVFGKGIDLPRQISSVLHLHFGFLAQW